MKRQAFLSLGVLAFILLSLSACACLCDEPLSQSPAYIQMAPMAPPAPLEEEEPQLNEPFTNIWRPGHWDYAYDDQGQGHFDWISGEVIARPSPTAVWSADRWAERAYGWVFVPGTWQ